MQANVPRNLQRPFFFGRMSDDELRMRIAMGFKGAIGPATDPLKADILPVSIWGRNEDVEDAGIEILTSAAVTLQTADVEHEVLSSDTNDDDGDTGANTIRVVCLNAAGQCFYQDVTMNGSTPVTMGTNYQYTLGAWVLTTGSSGGTNEGNITIRVNSGDVFQTAIVAGRGRSTEGIYVVPAGYDLFIPRDGIRGQVLATANTANAGKDAEFSVTVQETSAQVMYASGNAGLASTVIPHNEMSIPPGSIIRLKSQEVGGATAKALLVVNGYLVHRRREGV